MHLTASASHLFWGTIVYRVADRAPLERPLWAWVVCGPWRAVWGSSWAGKVRGRCEIACRHPCGKKGVMSKPPEDGFMGFLRESKGQLAATLPFLHNASACLHPL
jgi:hypothetical protein